MTTNYIRNAFDKYPPKNEHTPLVFHSHFVHSNIDR